MLIEIAIGDAYGRSFEFNTREFIETNNIPENGYVCRNDEESSIIGRYTDDTQMSIAVAQHMLSSKFHASSIHYAHSFIHAYKRDVRGGYSKRLKAAFEGSEKALGFLECVNPKGMSSNGSVMRSVPLGLLPDVQDIISHSIAHTTATHHSMDAINGAMAVALTAHYLYYDLAHTNVDSPYTYFSEYECWLTNLMGVEAERILYAYKNTPSTGVPCDAVLTASWCINLAMRQLQPQSWRTALKFSVELGGDVDSIAAITMGLMSLGGDPIPQDDLLVSRLENADFGKDYLMYLDGLLLAKYPKQQKIIDNGKLSK